MRNELLDAYVEWMYRLVYNNKYSKKLSYRKLITSLNDTEFIYILGMDENRSEDGVDLRYRFGYEHGYDGQMIKKYIDQRPCSILEMMIALCIRCEEQIMDDPLIGDRTGQWFWNMILSLGLEGMSDCKYDENYVDMVLYNFVRRNYSSNGKGGLFVVEDAPKDMRQVEIWYQMCWYLNSISK